MKPDPKHKDKQMKPTKDWIELLDLVEKLEKLVKL